MIKIQYWRKEACIIEKGELVHDTGGISEIYAGMDKMVKPNEGDPDVVIGNRLIKLLGNGKIIVKEPFEIEEGIEY